jgi:hypothetical protein
LIGPDGINGVSGINGADGENVDTDAVVSAINNSNDFLKSSTVVSAYTDNFSPYNYLFSDQQQTEQLAQVDAFKLAIETENQEFLATVKSKFTFTSSAQGYESRILDLSNWGSFDVSINRFAEHFGGIGNIVYFFASLLALSIVLSGVRF